MKTFAIQILSIMSLVSFALAAPLSRRAVENNGTPSHPAGAPHKLNPDGSLMTREFEDPTAREFSVITKDTTRVPLGNGAEVIIEDYKIQTFDDDAILVLPTDAQIQRVGNPFPDRGGLDC